MKGYFMLLGGLLTGVMGWAQESIVEIPKDLRQETLLVLYYPEASLDWERSGDLDEGYFRRQQRIWNRQVPKLNRQLEQELVAYPFAYALIDSQDLDSMRMLGHRYLLEPSFAFTLSYEKFQAGEAVLDRELIPLYTGPIGIQKTYDPVGQGEVSAPIVQEETRLYYWRILDLDSGDRYYFPENHDEWVAERPGLHGSLPFVLPYLIEDILASM
ncbi:MAG: hypothetical protein AAF804_17830 [Bacteroidota bacterium]